MGRNFMNSLSTKLLFEKFWRWQTTNFAYVAMCAFMLGIILAAAFGFAPQLLLPLAAGVGIFLLLSLLLRLPELLYIVFMLLGLLWCGLDLLQMESFAVPNDEAIFFDGKVVEVIEHSETYFDQLAEYETTGHTFIIKGRADNGWCGRLMVIASPVKPKVGDELHLVGIVREFSQTHNFYLAENNYLRNHGIAAAVQPTPDGLHFDKLAAKYSPQALGEAVRQKVYASLEVLPALQQALVKGMGFGDTSMLTGGQNSVLQQTGIMHIFAVSGLHIVYVVMLAGAILNFIRRRLLLDYKFIIIGTILLVLFFDMVVGFSPSVLRSTIMTLAALLSMLLLKPHSASRALIASAFLLLLWQPLWIFQPGFILSFMATAAIIYTTAYWQVLVKNQALAVSLAAQFMTMPVVAYFFNTVSIIGAILSLPVVFGSGIVVILSLLAMLLAPFGLALIPLVGAGLLAEWLYKLAELFAALPQSFLYTMRPDMGTLLLYYSLLLAAYAILARFIHNKDTESTQNDQQTDV